MFKVIEGRGHTPWQAPVYIYVAHPGKPLHHSQFRTPQPSEPMPISNSDSFKSDEDVGNISDGFGADSDAAVCDESCFPSFSEDLSHEDPLLVNLSCICDPIDHVLILPFYTQPRS